MTTTRSPGTKFGTDARPRPSSIAELDMPEFGQPIGPEARKAGRDAVKAMWPASTKNVRRRLVDLVATWLEKDEPHTAMLEATAVLDLTGAYRLIATLATS